MVVASNNTIIRKNDDRRSKRKERRRLDAEKVASSHGMDVHVGVRFGYGSFSSVMESDTSST
jgi:hypothetical protein